MVGSRKSLSNVFQDGMCHPKMAMVIDDRSKVWEDKDQSRVHVVPAFTPYYAPQAEVLECIICELNSWYMFFSLIFFLTGISLPLRQQTPFQSSVWQEMLLAMSEVVFSSKSHELIIKDFIWQWILDVIYSMDTWCNLFIHSFMF